MDSPDEAGTSFIGEREGSFLAENPSPNSLRTYRPIASQACTTCRTRKTKCDQTRPRCGLCERINVLCVYQEPKPMKKDKTLQEILNTLDVLHQKVDRLGDTSRMLGRSRGRGSNFNPLGSTEGFSQMQDRSSEQPKLQFSLTRPVSSFDVPYGNRAEVHRILSWPAVEQLLRSDLDEIHQWDTNYASTEEWLDSITRDFGRPIIVQDRFDIVTQESPYIHSTNMSRTMILGDEAIDELVSAYFASFHFLYPILDREKFYDVALPEVKARSFEEASENSPLVLLVLALGTVAQQGTVGAQICEPLTDRETGVKGGDVQAPPGINFLHEALRRMGILLPRCNLQLLQCHLLSAIYYSQCSQNLEYWRMIESSCRLCRSLTNMVHRWTNYESDMISRSYWMCVLLESGPTGELGLTRTRITDLQNSMTQPDFISESMDGTIKQPRDDDLLIANHFLAHVSLGKILNNVNLELRSISKRPILASHGNISYAPVIEEMSDQLRRWRVALEKVGLNWFDDATLGVTSESVVNNPIDLTVNGAPYQVLDPNLLLTANLQTRYKFALYLVYRPYIYKALHMPEQVKTDDLRGCAMALHACTVWPLLLPIFQEQKRLLPHLYEYSHTFFSLLVLLHVCRSPQTKVLRQVLESEPLMADIENTTSYLLQWLRDMQVVHPVAAWCYRIVEALYKDHPMVKE